MREERISHVTILGMAAEEILEIDPRALLVTGCREDHRLLDGIAGIVRRNLLQGLELFRRAFVIARMEVDVFSVLPRGNAASMALLVRSERQKRLVPRLGIGIGVEQFAQGGIVAAVTAFQHGLHRLGFAVFRGQVQQVFLVPEVFRG